MVENPERRRAASLAVVERKRVRAAIASAAVGLEELQRDAAFLNAAVAHGASDKVKELRTLRQRLATTKTKLDKAVGKLPPHLRVHGRVIDLQKAISSLELILAPDEGELEQ